VRLKFLKNNKTKPEQFSEEQLEKCAAFFDVEYYRDVSDRADLSIHDSLKHYLTTGWLEGLNPSAKFSTQGYLEAYPDVAESGVNPLLHYAIHGIAENRDAFESERAFVGSFERLTERGVAGWAVDQTKPDFIGPLQVFINGTFYATISNDVARPDLAKHGKSKGAGGFELAIPFHKMEAGSYLVEVELPDGTRLEKSIEIKSAGSDNLRCRAAILRDAPAGSVKVVVPIFNALDDLRVCIERLKQYTPADIETILIDDCSTDPGIAPLLDATEDGVRFKVLRNDRNLGFTRTVNRGLVEAGDADVIILNSDARVTPRWAEGLYAAAYSRPKVSTVTAMSDRAGAFSAPNIGNDNPLPRGLDEEKFACAFRRRSLRLYPSVPTGNGFCMYIRRAAIDELGPLDEDAFPRGYGEENDFCMRAVRAGWSNLIDDATYVFHDRSKSFGEEKKENIFHGRKIIDDRYPEYKKLIGKFHTDSNIIAARFRARMALEDCITGRQILPRALFVLATRTGGTPQTNADLMLALEDTFECFVLNCDAKTLELSSFDSGETRLLYTHKLSERIEPLEHRSSEYNDTVSRWLDELDLDIVHIRHLGWHSLDLPEIAQRTGARVVCSFHDFYTLCPSLKLLDDKLTFCGGTCTAGEGLCKVELWPPNSVPALKNNWVHHWRKRMEKSLSFCDSFITTSHSARERISAAFPSLPEDQFHVIPHGRNFRRFETLRRAIDGIGPTRILVPGNIDKAKGLELILALLELDRLGDFEFHILGNVHKAALGDKLPARLFLHGQYNRADFARKVHAIGPHFGVVFSIWDETYCHTLTEMWSVGLPVAVLDFPTLRSRVEDSGAGWVLEDMRPEAILRSLTEITRDEEGMAAKEKAVVRWQARRGSAQSCRQMASRYLDVYRGIEVGQATPKVAVVSPGSADLRNAYPSTEIRVWERTRNQLDRPLTYVRSTPAGLIAKMEMGLISAAIIQRNALPARMIEPFLATADETGTPYLLELDDHLIKVPKDKDENGYYEDYAPYLEKLLNNASAIIVSTAALAEEMRSYNDNVHCVENRISARLWADKRKDKAPSERRLLYMGGPTHDEDLAFAIDAIEIARRNMPLLRLTVIGATTLTDLPEWVDVVEVPAEKKSYSLFVPWLRANIGTAALGIAPLLDTAFNSFKSDLKVLDYGALGLPVLASDVESYRTFRNSVSDGITLLPNDLDVWARQIVEEFSDLKELRKDADRLNEWVFENRRIEDDLQRYDELVARYVVHPPQ